MSSSQKHGLKLRFKHILKCKRKEWGLEHGPVGERKLACSRPPQAHPLQGAGWARVP